MSKFFKVKTNYLKQDNSNENGVSNVSEVRLFQAVDYMDAQTQAIELINKEGCMGEAELDIQKVSYDHICLRGSCEGVLLKDVKECEKDLIDETYWYEVKVTLIVINDKDEEKYTTIKALVEGEDLEDALNEMRNYMTSQEYDEENWWFTSVQETPIEDVILLNN